MKDPDRYRGPDIWQNRYHYAWDHIDESTEAGTDSRHARNAVEKLYQELRRLQAIVRWCDRCTQTARATRE